MLAACTKPPLDEQQMTALADSVEQYVAGPFLAAFNHPNVTYQFTLAAPQVTVLSRDAAVYTTMVASTMKDSAGVETRMRFAWTGVFVRTAGGWKVQAEHSSYPPVPAPAAAPARPVRSRR